MARLVWSEQSAADLLSIRDYLIGRNPSAAEKYLLDVRKACQSFEDFPESGRRYDRRYRILVIRNHVVFYRFDSSAEKVTIAAVIDGRRDVARLVKGLK